jgi:hypothetical protein
VKNPAADNYEIAGGSQYVLTIVSSIVNQALWKFFLQVFADCADFLLIYSGHSGFLARKDYAPYAPV